MVHRPHPLRRWPGSSAGPRARSGKRRPERGRLHGPHVRARPDGERRRPMTTDVTRAPEHRRSGRPRLARTAGAVGGGAGEIDAEGVCAWFSGRLVLERVDPDHGAVQGDRADRSLGLREVDLPPHPQPDARGRPRRPAGRLGQARRGGHLRRRPAGRRHPPPHRHGVPEAQPVPGHDHRRQRAVRAQVLAALAGQPRRPGRGDADQGGSVERGQGPARRARRGALRRSAAAPVHRPGPGRAAPGPAHGRAVLGPRPDLHPAHRADHQGDRRRGDRGHRHPQHAAGPAGLRLLRLLPGRGERAGPGRGIGPTPRRSSAIPPIRGRSTMSMASLAERRRAPAPVAGRSPPARCRWCVAALPPCSGAWHRPGPAPRCSPPGPASPAWPSSSGWARRSTLYGLNINWQVRRR